MLSVGIEDGCFRDDDLNALFAVAIAFGQDGEDWCLLYSLKTPK